MHSLQKFIWALIIAMLIPVSSYAHKPSDSYLTINSQSLPLSGRWDIAIQDLEYAIGVDANGDGSVSWGELKSKQSEIEQYAAAHIQLAAGGKPCKFLPEPIEIDKHSDGSYVVIPWKSECEENSAAITLSYSLFFNLDPTHRGIARITDGESSSVHVLSPENSSVTFERVSSVEHSTFFEQLTGFITNGIWHILIGYDHILFLITLLLPSVMFLRDKQWFPVPNFRGAFFEVLKVVTSFTVAHSFTLALVVMSVINPPSRLVESVIAFSIIVTSLNNIFPVVSEKRWVVSFIFGLVHGCGFAAVLADSGLIGTEKLPALIGFNLGVEIGQLSIVALVLPLLYLVRKKSSYKRYGLVGGSIISAGFASIWMIERVFNVNLF